MHGTMNKRNSEKNRDFTNKCISPLEKCPVANELGLVEFGFYSRNIFEHGLEEGNLFLKNDVLKETELLLEHYFSGDCPDFFESSFSSCWDKFSTTSLGLQTILYGETVTMVRQQRS